MLNGMLPLHPPCLYLHQSPRISVQPRMIYFLTTSVFRLTTLTSQFSIKISRVLCRPRGQARRWVVTSFTWCPPLQEPVMRAVLMEPTSSSTTPSGSGTEVGRHELSSGFPTPGASHEGGSAVPMPACISTESGTSTESIESIETECQTDILGTERIPPLVKLYDFEYFGKLSDTLL